MLDRAIFILALSASLVIAAPPAPAQSLTKPLPGTQCSVTSSFVLDASSSKRKSLAIAAAVVGSGASHHPTYFTTGGLGLAAGPTTRIPFVLSTARTAYLGHAYRTKATAKVTYNGGTYIATASGRTFAP